MAQNGLSAEEKRAARTAFKERKREAGIYAIRCLPTGAVWVGAAKDLATIQNRRWFTLRTGADDDPALQAAWRAHGAEAFVLETLERLDPKLTTPLLDMELRDRLRHWRAEMATRRD